jgi:hypothetical protein
MALGLAAVVSRTTAAIPAAAAAPVITARSRPRRPTIVEVPVFILFPLIGGQGRSCDSSRATSQPRSGNRARFFEATSFTRWGSARIFLDRVHHARGVDERRPCIYRNCDTQRFRNLLLGCAVANGGFGMDRDTAVAARRNGDRESDKLADLRSEQILFLAGRTEIYPLIVSRLSCPASFTPTASCLR